MIYQGGDDCLAFKPNSTGITARNITCHGGTGIAFGSIGQYKTKLDFLEDIHLEDISILPSSQHLPKNGLYYKSWMGNEYGTPPNGGGGGHGYARNITVDGFKVENVHRPIFLQSECVHSPHVLHRAETERCQLDLLAGTQARRPRYGHLFVVRRPHAQRHGHGRAQQARLARLLQA